MRDTWGRPELHEDWRAKAWGLGDTVDTPARGQFVGLDEWGGMILKTNDETRIFPLTDMLDT